MIILADYTDVANKAGEIAECGQRIAKTSQHNIGSVGTSLNGGWKGDSSQAFNKKLIDIQSKLVFNASVLEQAANEMKNTANRYKQLEDLGAEIFGKFF